MKKALIVIFAAAVSGCLAAKRAWLFGDSPHTVVRDGFFGGILCLIFATIMAIFKWKS